MYRWSLSGEVYVTHSRGYQGNVVKRINPSGIIENFTDGIPGVAGIARGADSNLYCAASVAGSLYRIAPDGSAPEVASGLSMPMPVVCHTNGDVYVGTGGDHSVFRVPGGSGTPVRLARLTSSPLSLAIGPEGNIIVGTAPSIVTGSASIFSVAPNGTVTE